MMAHLELDENCQAETGLLAIDIGAIAAQQTGFFQVADAPQTG
jgi:hypothetical protein